MSMTLSSIVTILVMVYTLTVGGTDVVVREGIADGWMTASGMNIIYIFLVLV